MFRFHLFVLVLMLSQLLTACSSTTLTGSWRNPAYSERIDKIYIVGVSRQTTHRRIFEDAFGRAIRQRGVATIASYTNIVDSQDIDHDQLIAKVRASNADAFLVTRILDKRTEEVVNPGRVVSTPVFRGYRDYHPESHLYHYRQYHLQRYELIYEPPTVSTFVVVTLESNLYDTATEELIWSAQLETGLEGSVQRQVDDFVRVVTADLVEKGLI